MSRRLVVVIGSHALGEDPRAYAWADLYLQELVIGLSRAPGAQVITGGEPGPEVWVESLCHTFDVPCTAYLRNGGRRHAMRNAGRWTPEVLTGSAAVSRRDHMLVERTAAAHQAGVAVEVIALLDDAASPRSSSSHRVQLAESAGLPVDRRVWGTAPAAAPSTLPEAASAAA